MADLPNRDAPGKAAILKSFRCARLNHATAIRVQMSLVNLILKGWHGVEM